MKLGSLVRLSLLAWLAGAASVLAQAAATPPATGATPANTKIAVIDIDRVAATSEAGKTLFDELRKDNESLSQEKARREQEIRELQTKATSASALLSADARELLRKDIERKTTDAERWLQDKQKEFQDKQQRLEDEFQKKLAPVVEAVAKESGIGLILRATAGLTFVLDANLDITSQVIAKLNTMSAAPAPPAPKTDAAKTPPKP